MTTYAKIIDGEPVQPYPYRLANLYNDYPGTSFPQGIWPGDLETFNVVEVVETTAPTPTSTQFVSEALPTNIEGVWTQTWTTYDWSVEEIADALAAAKLQKNAEINAARSTANQSYFVYDTKQIACDPLSRGDIDGTNGYVSLYGTMPPGFPGAWKAIDNTYVSIPDVDTWKLFYTAMFAQGAYNFGKSQYLKGLLASATTVEQVAAISW